LKFHFPHWDWSCGVLWVRDCEVAVRKCGRKKKQGPQV
jgi:hypothetical protein